MPPGAIHGQEVVTAKHDGMVTADGHSTASRGLSPKEEASVATRIDMVQAINLDGGGSAVAVAGAS
jgi:exopolysaccharide biosynthesis protein